jgi:3-oxoadipate CoA-transferase beta subunit
VVDIVDARFVLREKLPGMSLDELQALTGATLVVDGSVRDLSVPEV